MELIILAVLALASVIFCILTMATNLIAPKKDYADLIIYEGPKPVPASKAVSAKCYSKDSIHFKSLSDVV